MNLPRELTPEVSVQSAVVTTLYPGASPEEVEKLVTAPIEDAIEENVNKVDLLFSTSSEGRSVIFVDFEEISDRDFDKELENLRTAVEQVNELPEEILDDPRVKEFDISFGFPILTIVVGGNIAETQMRDIAENLKDEVSDIKNVAAVRMAGLREREIWIEVNPDRLKAHRLPISAVITALGTNNSESSRRQNGAGKHRIHDPNDGRIHRFGHHWRNSHHCSADRYASPSERCCDDF